MAATTPLERQEVVKMLHSRAFASIGEAKRNRAIFAMQLTLGPRIHEILALNVSDVVFSHGELKPSVYFHKTKTGVPREIDANNPIYSLYLYAWVYRLDELGMLCGHNPLFPGTRGRLSRQQVYHVYRSAANEIGVHNCGTHSARKTWAVNTYDYWAKERAKGRHIDPLVMVQRLGGWTSLEACARYLGFETRMGRESQFHLYEGWNLGGQYRRNK